MKKKLLILIVMICFLITTGCFNGSKDVAKNFKKKVDKAKGYYLTGEMEIINNEDSYLYDVDVSYKDDDYFRVSLKNKTNDHEQIILKNDDGVYVLTPSLNKSFKFQSEWPYNNSQSYLLQTLVSDIENDSNKKLKKKKDGYVVTTTVNYSNNKNLVKQKIYFDKNSMVEKVEVIDKDGNVKIKMNFNEIDLKAKFDDDYFKLDMNMSSKEAESTIKEIEDITYPMYMPENTYLASEDKVSLDEGERVILTFLGDNPFTLIEQTVTVDKQFETINMNGEPTLLVDTIGSIDDNSITWISNGIEYYATSETLSEDELLDVVKSVSTIPIEK